MSLGEKAVACLRIAALRHGERNFPAAELAYREACDKWSQKAVDAKFQQLVDKGYLECGVSARTGWLTEKGREHEKLLTEAEQRK